MSRYVIYGAGAIGGVIGGLLHAAGREVQLIARGAHGEAIASTGLRLEGPEGSRTFLLPVVDRPEAAEIAEGDVVILAMKSQDTSEALGALAGCAGRETAVVCAQNGVENERSALRSFERVYGCLVILSASHLEPGVVTHSSGPIAGVLDVGRYPAGVDGTARRVAADLRAAGFLAEARTDIVEWKRRKLLANLSNAVGALFGEQEGARDLSDRARREGFATLAAARLEVTPAEIYEERIAPFRAQPVARGLRTGSSSWQSLARGLGTVEADYLNGEVALLGRLHGVPTPVNTALQRLSDEHARRHTAPGSLGKVELGALIALTATGATGATVP